jgi:hypothetical protein
MLITIIVCGAALLVALAITIGVSDGRAQRAAWKRIASARRELWEWEEELIHAAEGRGCAGCQVLRRRAELLDAA